MKRIIIHILFTFLFSNENVYSQTEEIKSISEKSKNSLYFSAGIQFVYVETNLNYERVFYKTTCNNIPLSIAGKLSFGYTSNLNFGNKYICSPGLTLLTGEKKSHFELSPAINFFFMKKPIHKYYSPSIAIGYRYQDLNKKGLIFNAGTGWPKSVYIGLGWSF